jgi:hypothetical protein
LADTLWFFVSSYQAAGLDQSICVNGTATLTTDDFGYGGNAVTTWTSVAAPALAPVIADPTSYTTGVTGFNTPGTYQFEWNIDGCRDTMNVFVSSCVSDSVWPGDANANHLVDNNDLLPIGLAYDSTGSARTGASIVWVAQASRDWSGAFSGGINYKHADCNGDGIINANDTVAILQNFGLTHSKNDGDVPAWRSGIPGLSVKYSRDTITNGDTVTVNIILGDAANPVTSIYGLAFTFNYDPAVMDSNVSSFKFANSWFYNPATTIAISKDLKALGRVKAAVTGINHQNRGGNGVIASYKATITTGNINGKNLSYYNNRVFISDITATDVSGSPITLNAGVDSNRVAYTPTGINEINYVEQIAVYPNPAAGKVQVTCANAMQQIQLMDITGKVIRSLDANEHKAVTMELSGINAGIYFVQVTTAQGRALSKLSITK